jgi:hypothetical protein
MTSQHQNSPLNRAMGPTAWCWFAILGPAMIRQPLKQYSGKFVGTWSFYGLSLLPKTQRKNPVVSLSWAATKCESAVWPHVMILNLDRQRALCNKNRRFVADPFSLDHVWVGPAVMECWPRTSYIRGVP